MSFLRYKRTIEEGDLVIVYKVCRCSLAERRPEGFLVNRKKSDCLLHVRWLLSLG